MELNHIEIQIMEPLKMYDCIQMHFFQNISRATMERNQVIPRGRVKKTPGAKVLTSLLSTNSPLAVVNDITRNANVSAELVKCEYLGNLRPGGGDLLGG